MKRYSLYTDVVLFFFSFFSKTPARARERARSARKKRLFSSSPIPTLLPRRSINPPGFLFFITRARRTLKRKKRVCEQSRNVR